MDQTDVSADDGSEKSGEITYGVADGGPAFPWGEHGAVLGGMTLRDYFAGQALAGLTANSIEGSHHMPHNVVRDAYQLADLMIVQRIGDRSDEPKSSDSE